ncbi:hypothetical protein ACHAXN_008251 [Cyclotella atomus]
MRLQLEGGQPQRLFSMGYFQLLSFFLFGFLLTYDPTLLTFSPSCFHIDNQLGCGAVKGWGLFLCV